MEPDGRGAGPDDERQRTVAAASAEEVPVEASAEAAPVEVPADGRPMPLAGIRVVDVSSILAGPLCCQILGDFG
ncbi:MAG: CoA transferase, partial [Actinomycetota bacterium]|nr:CoA transferase [Actinomycetota bacterium]